MLISLTTEEKHKDFYYKASVSMAATSFNGVFTKTSMIMSA